MAEPYGRSGQITVTTAGTAVAGPAVDGSAFAIKAHPNNTKPIWIGNDGTGTVSTTTGFPLQPGEGLVLAMPSLSLLRVNAEVNGEKACWVRLW